jgi:hypothetical protein
LVVEKTRRPKEFPKRQGTSTRRVRASCRSKAESSAA